MSSDSGFSSVRRVVTILAAFACLMLAPVAGRAAVAQWTGGSSGIWGNAAGWSGGVVPNNTQSVTYLATVAQAVGAYSTVVISDATPTVEVDQLTIRPTAAVIVGVGSTLRLRDIGAGASLQRSLVGGGQLQVNGTLSVALNGGVISGSSLIYMNGGRISGTGRIENARIISGYGTIGNASGAFDSNLGVYNIGANGADPSLVRITADSATRTLVLGPSASSPGILNNYATLSANFGGTLDIRGNGTTLNNNNGLVQATGSTSEIRLLANVNINNEAGTINGAGTIRVPAGESATIGSTVGRTISVAKFVAEGDLTARNQTFSGDLHVLKNFNADTVTISNHLLLKADTGTPAVKSLTTTFTNSGLIEGGGSINATQIVNSGAIEATYAAWPLTLTTGSAGVSLTQSAALRARTSGATLYVGNTGAAWTVVGAGTTTLAAGAGATLDVGANVAMSAATANIDGTLKLRNSSNVGSILGSGDLIQYGTLDTTRVRLRSLDVDGSTRINGPGNSALTSLVIRPGEVLDLRSQLVLASNTSTTLSSLRGYAAEGQLISGAGKVVGMAFGSAIGAGTFVFNDEPVSPTSIILLATQAGDANLDKVVEFADLVRLAQSYNGQGSWTNGDFNYDGLVNFGDLVLLAQNYNQSAAIGDLMDAGVGFAADWALAQSLVPEPATLGALGMAIALLGRRR